MPTIDSIIEFNRTFVENKEYENYETSKFPNKKLVVLTCMDTRLSELLPRAMNLQQGDAKIIKNAGAVLSHSYGSIMRSIIVALYELQAEEIAVVGHYGCGMTGLEPEPLLEKAYKNGLTEEKVAEIEASGNNVRQWLKGFENVEDSVRQSVNIIRRHPFLPAGTPVHGLVISPETGALTIVDKAE